MIKYKKLIDTYLFFFYIHLHFYFQVNYDIKFVLGPVPHAEIPYYVEDLATGGPQPTGQLEERVARNTFLVSGFKINILPKFKFFIKIKFYVFILISISNKSAYR